MSLLQNEEFLIWHLRTTYLTYNKDGVGERLINIDSSALFSDPGIRGAGYGANPDIQRTYSPPIPVATAVASEYFSAPIKTAGFGPSPFGDEDEERGMVIGKGSADTVGPGPQTKRRKRREQQEDDSSDLSDESDDEAENAQRAAQQIKFAKMPVRSRAGSSPIQGRTSTDIPDVTMPSPSKPRADGGPRRGSMGAVDAVKQRARRDTTTSSDLSSENELDASVFKRRQLRPSRPNRNITFLEDQEEEDEEDVQQEKIDNARKAPPEESDNESHGTSLSSEFAETADSESLLDEGEVDDALDDLSLGAIMPAALNVIPASPRKARNQGPNTLQALPPPRPISTIVPVSALGQAIRARKAKPKNPIEAFARFSGKGALAPLNIKIYAPFSQSPDKPFDMQLLKTVQDNESGAAAHVTVSDAIGLCLWRYHEDGLEPSIPMEKSDVNRWTLRIVDDGEVEYDFPALNRASNMVDFTSNNNRPVRGRSRGKAFDEFALVEATEAQYTENKRVTPKYTKQFEESTEGPSESTPPQQPRPEADTALIDGMPLNTIINRPFAFMGRKGSTTLDQPAFPLTHSTPRTGPQKMLKIHFTSLEAHTQNTTLEVTTDTYIAEVLDLVCKRWGLDKAHHFLRIAGTSTVAALDRIVEVLGNHTDLDLIRRRLAHDTSFGGAGSPSSSSPSAPLLLTTATPPPPAPQGKGRKKSALGTSIGFNTGGGGGAASAAARDHWPLLHSTTTGSEKKYNVVRKQPMSFTPSQARTLLMDGEYLHMLPAETTTKATLMMHGGGAGGGASKTTTVPFSLIVGCKVSRRHPRSFRVVIFRERETKRYDFEAASAQESAEIVEVIRKAMEPFSTGVGMG